MRSQLLEPGRQGNCYLFVPGTEQCQPLWGLLWAVTQVSQVEVKLLSWAESDVQQVQKLELWSPISRMAL